MTRELIVLGTASQAPTRHRNHNGYALRWDDQLIVFDPGEGFQRQCLLANLTISRATGCCVTHFHGDHSLGLPGFLQRRALDGATSPIPIWYPADGQVYLDRLRTGTIWNDPVGITEMPVRAAGNHGSLGLLNVTTQMLDHRVTTVGYRLQEDDRVGVDAAALGRVGIRGRDIGRLIRRGELSIRDERGDARTYYLKDFGRPRRGQSMAFIMDTRLCDAAFELAEGVDLLVCESTFLASEADLAEKYGHLTAAQAGTIAAASNARRLVLTHFSQRHPDSAVFHDEAAEFHGDVVVASDLARIPVPDALSLD